VLHAVRRLRHIEGIRTCEFSTSDVVRHSLVEKIIRAFEEERHPQVEEPSEGRNEGV
jgi:phosphate starvation-inducible protein PhoH